MKKKIVALLSSLLSVTILLSSCSKEPQDFESENEGGIQEEVQLTLWTFPVGNWGDPTAVANILSGFHKEYPGIHISVEYLSYENGDEKINQAVLDGSTPDLVL